MTITDKAAPALSLVVTFDNVLSDPKILQGFPTLAIEPHPYLPHKMVYWYVLRPRREAWWSPSRKISRFSVSSTAFAYFLLAYSITRGPSIRTANFSLRSSSRKSVRRSVSNLPADMCPCEYRLTSKKVVIWRVWALRPVWRTLSPQIRTALLERLDGFYMGFS